ncbi:MAG: glycosyltransferase family 4 protein [Proteobacteria bacterium]|nr:glycosyltransferase family 4 protein [Pseudomonadota bacterium]MBU1641571.1 glycosyltransferase family 4 protein [Pseudomonadota bacterium]
MNFVFSLFNYFPFGGLERDFMAISRACLARGHAIKVYAMSWHGEIPAGLDVHLVKGGGRTNHSRAAAFYQKLGAELAGSNHDLLVGFNKMPNLDVYYAADVCYRARVARQRSFLTRFTPRYRLLAAFEEAVFAPGADTDIIYLAGQEKRNYQKAYNTPDCRFYYGPPGVDVAAIRSQLHSDTRQQFRNELGLKADDVLLLMIGSNFHTKGVERSIRALAALPDHVRRRSFLHVIGRGKEGLYQKLAGKLGVAAQVHFEGGRDDVPRFLAAADFLLQPSLTENTGNAIVEALVAGVPVLATETCGYSEHVLQANSGLVVGCTPFRQEEMNTALVEMITSPQRQQWQENALRYSQQHDLGNRPQVVADILEQLATKRRRG